MKVKIKTFGPIIELNNKISTKHSRNKQKLMHITQNKYYSENK